MPPYLRLAIQIIVVIAAVTLISQPYNWYCAFTQKCRSFSFSYYFPKSEGKKEFDIEIEAQNFFENVEFYPEIKEVRTVTNRKQKVVFHLKNMSKRFIILRPKLLVDPEDVEQYVKYYQCPCGQQIRLKAAEEVTLEFEFEIDGKFEKNERRFYKSTVMGYPIILRMKL